MSILLIIYVISAAGLIIFDMLLLSRLPFYKALEVQQSQEPVSLIICARNEENNLKVILPLLHNQNYDQFEIIVVNDASTDNTLAILEEHTVLYPELRIASIDAVDKLPGKKAALAKGISLAKFDILLFTDADCRPRSQDWIKGMAAQFERHNLILGYSPFEARKGLAGNLSSWDNFETAMLYFGFARAGMPYMGVGRNLAYRKSLYHQGDALGRQAGLASGDDDLKVGAMAQPNSTGIEFREPYQTISKPAISFGQWWNQKRRHLTTAPFYKPLIKWLLGFYGAAKLIFYTLLPLWILIDFPSWLFYLIVVRICFHYAIMLANATRLKQWRIIILYPLWEFLSTFLLALVHLSNFIKPKKEAWS